MTSDPFSKAWRLPMLSRNPNESHRQSSFLELFFDLCFVVAIAQAATELHHAISQNHILDGVLGFFMVFFAIWWAWMNFTWFASAYDNDDTIFRIGTFIQIIGALVLAAGVAKGFKEQEYSIIILGYGIMRLGLISLWLRAAIHDVERRSVAIKYAVGLLVAMGGWTTLLFVDFWPLWIWFSMALVELLVPVWAESKKETPWHAGHIAERYGLLTIIVIGESVLSATTAVQVAINEELVSQSYLLQTIIGGLLIMLSIWWLYFSSPSERFLKSNKDAFRWGYGHFFIFMLIAAIGAGIAVNIEQVTGHSSISNLVAGGSVTIPAAVFLLIFWFVQIEPHKSGRWQVILYTLASILVGLATFLTWSILIAGLVFTILVAISIFLSHKKYKLELANN